MANGAITWKDLQSHSTHLSNPYAQLTREQTHRLSSLYQLKEWIKKNQPAPGSNEIIEAQRLEKSFIDENLDSEILLAQANNARTYWRSQSQVTNPDLENRSIQLSGYVLPLDKNAQRSVIKQVSEFLLVPYVGACIHVPPPPPNQIVHIKPEVPIDNPGLFSSVVVTGRIYADASSHELFRVDGSRTVDVSYAMDMDAIALAPKSTAPKITGTWWQTLPARVSQTLTVSLGRLSNQTSPLALALAMLLSFSYGVLHTLGPGHGKAVIISYFIGHDGSLRRGLAMGVKIAVFHVLSAVVIAILTNTILQQFGGNSAGSYRVIRLISYGAIALIGVRMLMQSLQSSSRNRKKSADSLTRYPTDLNGSPLDTNIGDSVLYPSLSQQISSSGNLAAAACGCLDCGNGREGGWLALAIGAVPCSGALLVLLYGLANNLLWPSVAMVISISGGMAVTLGWIGAMAIIGNRYGQKLTVRRQRTSPGVIKRPGLHVSLAQSGQVIGASFVSLLGMGLFFLTLLTAG
ncbi:MAG: DUF3299 domain-containing protein [Cyanobacteria bacterium P01_F01_bin.42]